MVDDHFSYWLWRKYVNAVRRESKLSRHRQAMPASEDMRTGLVASPDRSTLRRFLWIRLWLQSIAGPRAAFAVFCSGVASLAARITSNGRIALSLFASSTRCFAKSIAESCQAKSIDRQRNGPIE